MEGLADPGGNCVSRVVRDEVLDKLSFAFEDLGAQQVKNIARPVEATGSTGKRAYFRSRPRQQLRRTQDLSIVVLPFTELHR